MLKKFMVSGLVMLSSIVMTGIIYSKQNNEITIKSKSHLSIHIKPGSKYNFTILFFLNRPSTIACWLETTNGEYVDTIFVSHNAKTGEWYGHPQGQPGALPVWMNKAADKKSDAISGASLKGGAQFATNDDKSLTAGSYVVKFEVNKPYDYNDTYKINLPEDDPRYSGDNGQPSLIYEGKLEIGKGPDSSLLKLAGTGSPNGSDGQIHDLTGITSALKIIDSIEVSYEQ